MVGAAFGAAGQRCMALSTLVLVGETKEWLPDIVENAKALQVNGGFEKGADLGPVISPESKARIEDIIASAEKEGAKIMLDGRGFKPAKYPDGELGGLTLIADVTYPRCAATRRRITRARVPECRYPRRGDRPHQREPLRQRHRRLHAVRPHGRDLPPRHRGGPGGHRRAHPRPLPMFSFTGNKASIAGGGASTFYGRPGVNFYTQVKTVTALWRTDDAISQKADVAMPTHSSGCGRRIW